MVSYDSAPANVWAGPAEQYGRTTYTERNVHACPRLYRMPNFHRVLKYKDRLNININIKTVLNFPDRSVPMWARI